MKKAGLPDPETAVPKLLRYALILPPYFRNYDWQKAESEADQDMELGRTATFDNVADFLAELAASYF